MIVDPWGTVLARLDEGPGVVIAELDYATLRRVREQIPAMANRRPAAYDLTGRPRS